MQLSLSMKKSFFSLLHFGVLMLIASITFAQNSSLVFEQYGKLQGLPGKTTTALYQDSRNFLWIGTEHGIVRFDGKFFTHYNQIGEGGITDRIITCITEDADGNIWFGTESGLNKLNPYNNSIAQFNEGSGPGTIPFRWCNSLFTDDKKQLWLTTEKGIALYNSKQNVFINYPVTVAGKDEKINKFINQVIQDKKGNIWLSTSYGIKKINPLTKQYQSYHQEETNNTSLGQNVYYGICTDNNNNIWAITFGGQLFRYNNAGDKFDAVFTAPDKLMRFAALAGFNTENESSLLIATSDGLLQLNTNNLQQAPVKLLAGNNLTKIYTDRQQNIWVTSANGLFRHSAARLALQWHNLPGNQQHFVYHFIPVVNNSKQIFLTTTAGWYLYNSVTGQLTPHILPPDKNELLKNINRYTADENGYWFTSINGFGYYNTSANQLTDLTHIVKTKTGLTTTGHIVAPLKNQLWFTVRRSGIMIYNTLTKKDTLLFGNKETPDNIYGMGVSDLKLDAANNVWFTAAGKLYYVNPVTLQYKIYQTQNKLSNNKTEPYHILFTKSGRTIVNSVSNIYELKNGKLQLLYPAKGLFNFALYKLIETETGELWAVTDEGLYKTNTTFSVWKNISNFQGLENERPGFEINLSVPGKILLGSMGRIGVLQEDILLKKHKPLPVIISHIRFGNHENFMAASSVAYKCSFKDAVEIELTAPDFNNEKENKWLYRLEGWDKEWKILLAQNTVRYEQLPAGSYTFSCKSVNTDGKESNVTAVTFKVIPPFYRSWWFIVAVTCGIAGVAYLLYRYRLRKAVELEKIRTRIATDLHDDIGATLSSISMYSDAVKKQVKDSMPHLEPVLNKMGENSREMVAGMSDIVWAINPANDAGEKLIQRIENYATDMCAVKNIKLHFLANEKLKSLRLPLEQRKNVYLIFKEAINNAVKYSAAKNIFVAISQSDKELILMVKDDGCGFDDATVKKGNGLQNMQLRANEIKASLKISSAKDKGTLIEVKI